MTRSANFIIIAQIISKMSLIIEEEQTPMDEQLSSQSTFILSIKDQKKRDSYMHGQNGLIFSLKDIQLHQNKSNAKSTKASNYQDNIAMKFIEKLELEQNASFNTETWQTIKDWLIRGMKTRNFSNKEIQQMLPKCRQTYHEYLTKRESEIIKEVKQKTYQRATIFLQKHIVECILKKVPIAVHFNRITFSQNQQKRKNYIKKLIEQISTLQMANPFNNIMKFLGYSQDEHAIYVYSYLGKPFNHIQKTTHLEKLCVLEQVMKGLIDLEKNGLYNFDMKPRNIVIADSTIKIIDMGDVYRLQQGMLNKKGNELSYLCYKHLKKQIYRNIQSQKNDCPIFLWEILKKKCDQLKILIAQEEMSQKQKQKQIDEIIRIIIKERSNIHQVQISQFISALFLKDEYDYNQHNKFNAAHYLVDLLQDKDLDESLTLIHRQIEKQMSLSLCFDCMQILKSEGKIQEHHQRHRHISLSELCRRLLGGHTSFKLPLNNSTPQFVTNFLQSRKEQFSPTIIPLSEELSQKFMKMKQFDEKTQYNEEQQSLIHKIQQKMRVWKSTADLLRESKGIKAVNSMNKLSRYEKYFSWEEIEQQMKHVFRQRQVDDSKIKDLLQVIKKKEKYFSKYKHYYAINQYYSVQISRHIFEPSNKLRDLQVIQAQLQEIQHSKSERQYCCFLSKIEVQIEEMLLSQKINSTQSLRQIAKGFRACNYCSQIHHINEYNSFEYQRYHRLNETQLQSFVQSIRCVLQSINFDQNQTILMRDLKALQLKGQSFINEIKNIRSHVMGLKRYSPKNVEKSVTQFLQSYKIYTCQQRKQKSEQLMELLEIYDDNLPTNLAVIYCQYSKNIKKLNEEFKQLSNNLITFQPSKITKKVSHTEEYLRKIFSTVQLVPPVSQLHQYVQTFIINQNTIFDSLSPANMLNHQIQLLPSLNVFESEQLVSKVKKKIFKCHNLKRIIIDQDIYEQYNFGILDLSDHASQLHKSVVIEVKQTKIHPKQCQQNQQAESISSSSLIFIGPLAWKRSSVFQGYLDIIIQNQDDYYQFLYYVHQQILELSKVKSIEFCNIDFQETQYGDKKYKKPLFQKFQMLKYLIIYDCKNLGQSQFQAKSPEKSSLTTLVLSNVQFRHPLRGIMFKYLQNLQKLAILEKSPDPKKYCHQIKLDLASLECLTLSNCRCATSSFMNGVLARNHKTLRRVQIVSDFQADLELEFTIPFQLKVLRLDGVRLVRLALHGSLIERIELANYKAEDASVVLDEMEGIARTSFYLQDCSESFKKSLKDRICSAILVK